MRNLSMSRPMKDLSHDTYSRIQPHIHSWTKMYGTSFLYWLGTRPMLLISEPELIREILNNRDKIYPKAEVHAFIRKLIGDGVAASGGEKWSKMRKLANYAFNAETLKNMIPAMIASAQMVLERWKNHQGKEIEVVEEFKLLTSDAISRAAFGSSYEEGKKIFDMLTKLTMLVGRNAFKIKLPGISEIWKTGDEIEAEKLEKQIENSILQIIKKREDEVMAGDVENYGDDFLGILLKAYHDDDQSKRISLKDVIDECKTLYVAGQETTNVLLSWAVLLLAIHSEWQEEARNEVFKILGHQTPNADGIAKLKIMGMIINETLRLYPPVTGFVRKVDRKVRLGKLTLPADVNLQISTLLVHHDPLTWGEDVHLFKPERFSEGLAKATNNNKAAYLPFGLGPRTCIGFNFAITEAKIALSMILQRYAITHSPTYVHSPVQNLTIGPRHGIQVVLNPLQN
ncbi:hypothetical protein GH714_029444 [Hevea brasiliensis]|uniref:Cytochrome P450 n=1 Tax=Hevea brasiliensis TaxID=3981 RepID=A0A6A6NKX2_HEVBR|nr:hypothetical protein GH714_029444 [Hevea brasiliensis]